MRDAALASGITRLIALIDPANPASAAVARKIGLRLEREVVRPGGHVRQVYALEAGQGNVAGTS
jgi:RimJ/RimL family protein N-acetyltransferase